MSSPAPILEVSRSHDGYVLIIDAAGTLQWRLKPWAAERLAQAITSDFVSNANVCWGLTVVGCDDANVTHQFAWPRHRAEQAVLDLVRNAALCRLHPGAEQ
ncbi:hypothetical protein FHP25_24910 [Vineibacter terrae]|uniref:Uncharacterized protein n=1 Tax=Vineibacter terrae TaxID=2586908 RepID=A0A5C8PFG2_9HYPH|nr:hypothetical protein [Vineibacter terrae]TXL72539.1 hypothetical protein FHP25_24910 [Vineibacter terrae]